MHKLFPGNVVLVLCKPFWRRAQRIMRTPRYVLALLIAVAIAMVALTGTLWAQEDPGTLMRELKAISKELRAIVEEFRIKLPLAGFKGGEVHGQVVASYKGVERAFLTVPDVEVYVEDVVTGTKSTPVKTDLGGTYIIPKQPAGTYRVCWRKDGWIPECMDKTFTLKNVTAFPGQIGIRPVRTVTATATGAVQQTGIVRGRVQLADGGTCWFDQEFFELEETAVVELVELVTGTVVQRVRANDHGDFVLTKTPTNVAFQVRTRCGNEIVRTAVFPHLTDLSGGTPLQITVPNNTPRIKTVFATDGTKLIRRAPLGATVQVRAEAEDPDGDALGFDWHVLRGSGSLGASVTDTVTWTLPTTPGRHNLYVVVTDRRGGRHFKRMSFDVGTDQVLFGGIVVGSDGPAIAGAAVTVNGRQVITDGKGFFTVSVPAADNYVLHIEAEGYVEIGRRLQSAVAGTTWVMTKAFRQVIDPFTVTVIVDGRQEWIRPDPDKFPKARPRRPSRLTIEANALIGADGTKLDPANGPFNAYFATIDSNTELLPGDYTAVNRAGKTVFMESFGAAFIDVRDATGRKYTLNVGATAALEGAIQTPQLNNAIKPPATMGLFIFDPKSGNWIEQEQEATIAASGTSYAVKLSNFSTANFDRDKPNPACLRVNVDAGILGLGDVRARVDVATGTDSVERREIELDAFDNAFYNMPINAPFTIEVFQGAPPNDALIHAEAGNSGAPWGGTGVPPAPYTVCNAEVVLTFPTTPPVFLQYRKGTGSFTRAQGYYGAIGAYLVKPTLGDWWRENGFDAVDGSGGTRTSFLNHNDLGFGRDMHCRANGTIGSIGDPITGNVDIACYVTNYGEPDQEIGNANLAQVADKDTAIATVAMEYSAVAGQDPNDRIVKFYVYVGGNAASPITEAADLDKAGPKFVPNLCLICHGGNYNPANEANPTFDNINMGSSFREFDTPSFRYPGPDPKDSTPQDANFLVQNTIVYHSKPSPAIQELVEAFYASGSTVDPNAIPAGWFVPPVAAFAPQEDLYLKIVGKSCRTCHVAQPDYDPLASPLPVGTYPDWGTYELFRDNRDLAYFIVCSAKSMPNALVTFKNFWLSLGPHRPEFFETFVDAATGWTPALGTTFPCDP